MDLLFNLAYKSGTRMYGGWDVKAFVFILVYMLLYIVHRFILGLSIYSLELIMTV